jgi:maltose O-acetyltransferase
MFTGELYDPLDPQQSEERVHCRILLRVKIGENALFGPSVQIYMATRPMDAETRAECLEFAKSIVTGTDVWAAGAAIICPGVTVGTCSAGAGSVVTRDISR